MLISKGHGVLQSSLFRLRVIYLTCQHYSSLEMTNLRKAIQRGNIPQVQSAYNTIISNKSQHLINRDVLKKLLMTVRHGKRKENIDFIIRVLHDMKTEYRLSLTHFEYHALMYAYGVQGKYEKAYALLNEMRHLDQLEPNLHSYNILLGCYKRANELDKAQALFEEMKQQIKLDIVTYNTMLHFYLKNKEFDKLFIMYKELSTTDIQPDVYTFCTLLDAVIKSKQHVNIGHDIYQQLITTAHLDIHTINTMIRFIADIDLNQALDLYHDISTKYPPLQPDTVTFNILLDVCLKNNASSKAYALFKDMEELEVKPDVVTFGTLIDAEAKQENLKAALTLFQEMGQLFIEPNERILNSLVNMACSKQNTGLELDQLFHLSRKYSALLDTKAYNALLYGLALQGRSKQAQQIYDDVFRDMQFRLPDIATFTHLMLAYVNDNNMDDALSIYYTLREHHKKCKSNAKVKIPIELDTTFYSSIISALSNKALTDPLDTAMTLFNDMRKLRIQPTKHIYTGMLHACGQFCDQDVLDHVHQLIKVDLYLDPDIGIYNALMDAYNRIGDGDTVLDIWQTLTTNSSMASHLAPDQATVSIVLDSCGHNGRMQQAYMIWKWLKQTGFKLNTNNYNSFIECLCRQKGRAGWDNAYEIVKKEMTNTMDEKTINTLISFAKKKGFKSEEIEQLEQIKDKIINNLFV